MTGNQLTGRQILDKTIQKEDLANNIPLCITVKNDTGSLITKGTPVAGVPDSDGIDIFIKPLEAGDKNYIGILDEDINDGDSGVAVSTGRVSYNTNPYLPGTSLFFTILGNIVTERPSSPHIYLGICLDQNSLGSLYIPRDAGFYGSKTSIKRTSVDESINTSVYSGIRQTQSGINSTLTGATDGEKIRIYNASQGDNTIIAIINGINNPKIKKNETFDLLYHELEGEWIL